MSDQLHEDRFKMGLTRPFADRFNRFVENSGGAVEPLQGRMDPNEYKTVYNSLTQSDPELAAEMGNVHESPFIRGNAAMVHYPVNDQWAMKNASRYGLRLRPGFNNIVEPTGLRHKNRPTDFSTMSSDQIRNHLMEIIEGAVQPDIDDDRNPEALSLDALLLANQSPTPQIDPTAFRDPDKARSSWDEAVDWWLSHNFFDEDVPSGGGLMVGPQEMAKLGNFLKDALLPLMAGDVGLAGVGGLGRFDPLPIPFSQIVGKGVKGAKGAWRAIRGVDEAADVARAEMQAAREAAQQGPPGAPTGRVGASGFAIDELPEGTAASLGKQKWTLDAHNSLSGSPEAVVFDEDTFEIVGYGPLGESFKGPAHIQSRLTDSDYMPDPIRVVMLRAKRSGPGWQEGDYISVQVGYLRETGAPKLGLSDEFGIGGADIPDDIAKEVWDQTWEGFDIGSAERIGGGVGLDPQRGTQPWGNIWTREQDPLSSPSWPQYRDMGVTEAHWIEDQAAQHWTFTQEFIDREYPIVQRYRELQGIDDALEGPPGMPTGELTPESMVQAIREHYTAKWESMTPESRASWMQMGRMNSPDDLDGYLDGMVDNIVGGDTPLDPAIGWGNLPEGIERRAHEIAAEGPPGGVAREAGGKPAAPTSAVDDLPVPEEYLGDLSALHEKGTGELIIANPTVGDLVAKADELEGKFWAKIEPGLESVNKIHADDSLIGIDPNESAGYIYASVRGGGAQSIFRQLASQGEVLIPEVVSGKGWFAAGEAGDDLWEAYVDDFLTRYPDQDPIIFLSREVEEGVWAADRESGIQWSHLDAVGLSVREWLEGYALRKTARKVMEGGK